MQSTFRPSVVFAIAFLAIRLFGGQATASDPNSLELFEKQIRPALVKHCLRCHGVEKQQGGLRLDTREGWSAGGDSGAVIVAGDMQSLLLTAIHYEDSNLEMPPRGKLPESTLAAFRSWIESGAVDPRGPVGNPASAIQITPPSIEEGRQFWSFQPIADPPVPNVEDQNWPSTDIDRFILARLEDAGVQPVADAEPATLLRRVFIDLIGLPPTPRQIDRFLADPSPRAYEALVDRLLGSHHFGERWGRHWLDVVRFAESSGGGRTLLFPDAWRYRDYVIESINADVPFDRFVREQIAGDLLDHQDWKQRKRQLTATAFLLLGPTNYEMQDKEALQLDVVDEQMDTIGKALMGMTLGCARCHDHKFDPIPTRDYYAMAGVLNGTRSLIHSNVSQWNTAKLPLSPEDEFVFQRHEEAVKNLENELKRSTDAWKAAGGGKAKDVASDEDESIGTGQQSDSTPAAKKDEIVVLKKQVDRLRSQLKSLKKSRAARPVVMAAIDAVDPGDMHLAIRGVASQKGPPIPRGAIEVAQWKPFPEIPEGQSGRRELAEWIVDKKNPLPARVMSNRVWYWTIGRGLVSSVDNFGSMGERPSHPELLDHLSASFTKNNWSIKHLVREIVLSRVYRLSTRDDARAMELDPENRLCWRRNRKRLRAEDIRDSMLLVAGDLDVGYGGPTIKRGTKIEYGYRFDSNRRSVYLPVFRNTLPEIFEVFDFADPNIQRGQRNSSTVASQALLLMNHPKVMESSRHAAESAVSDDSMSSVDRLRFAFLQVLGREPTEAEEIVAKRLGSLEDNGEDATGRLALLYQVLFECVDFRYLD